MCKSGVDPPSLPFYCLCISQSKPPTLLVKQNYLISTKTIAVEQPTQKRTAKQSLVIERIVHLLRQLFYFNKTHLPPPKSALSSSREVGFALTDALRACSGYHAVSAVWKSNSILYLWQALVLCSVLQDSCRVRCTCQKRVVSLSAVLCQGKGRQTTSLS